MDLQIKSTVLVGYGLFFYVFSQPFERKSWGRLGTSRAPPRCAHHAKPAAGS